MKPELQQLENFGKAMREIARLNALLKAEKERADQWFEKFKQRGVRIKGLEVTCRALEVCAATAQEVGE